MRRAKYKCGYCNSKFELFFYDHQEIPERNVGCTNCRIAGEKVTLIRIRGKVKKIRRRK